MWLIFHYHSVPSLKESWIVNKGKAFARVVSASLNGGCTDVISVAFSEREEHVRLV